MSALGNLVAGVAHEINNPLGFIAGNLAPAEDYVRDLLRLIDLYQQKFPRTDAEISDELEAIDFDYIREDLPKLLNSMKEGVVRIHDISTSLRTFSRADQDHPVFFNIHDGINSTILILKHRLKANESRQEIKITTSYSEMPPIECFPGQLNQVFMNLLANAIDALEEANRGRTFKQIEENPNRIGIYTALIEDGQRIQIRIQDNGVGISDQVKQKVFDHVFTTKEIGKGTGLGLAISRQIVVEKHRGSIQVNSELGQGSEFIVTLPIHKTVVA
ncbi:sensor histidine kinase [Nostoc sp.]|uniref:sensor histidine kinase n=1 Tax=Nostoc sp. TaxID=1180 RepID=UPI002FF7FC60